MSGPHMLARLDVCARPEGMTAAQLAANLSRIQAVIAKEDPDHEVASQIKVI